MTADGSSDRMGQARLSLLVVITVILGGWALRATGPFMVPVVFSVFLALLVAPLDRIVADRLPPKAAWLGHAAAMGTILVALLVFVGMIWIAARQVADQFPMSGDGGNLLPQFGSELWSGGDAAVNAPAGSDGSGTAEGEAGPDATAPTPESGDVFARFGGFLSDASGSLASSLGDLASGIATRVLSAAGATLGVTVLVFFLTLIMLIEGPIWRRKIVNVLEAPGRSKAMESVGIIAERLRGYLVARTILGVITAALYVAWLWVFGVDLLVVWALLAFVLNYIPTLGSLIAGVLPVIYAFVQKDFGTVLLIGAGIFVIEQVMGNYVDPRLQGRQVSLSPLVVLITLLVWGWIWGVAGAILAVPITIAAMIVCAHVEPLRPFALMLSNASDMEELDRQATHPDRNE